MQRRWVRSSGATRRCTSPSPTSAQGRDLPPASLMQWRVGMPIASPRLAQAAIDGGTRTGEKPSMTDENEVKATSKLTLGGGRLDLKSKRDAAGQVAQVRQKFSHGRSNVVTVEVKKPPRRTGPAGPASSSPTPAPAPAPVTPAPTPAPTARTLRAVQPAGTTPAPQPGPSGGAGSNRGVVLRTLTSEEREARSRALVEAAKEDVVRR